MKQQGVGQAKQKCGKAEPGLTVSERARESEDVEHTSLLVRVTLSLDDDADS